jgi:acetamidase/formamidase
VASGHPGCELLQAGPIEGTEPGDLLVVDILDFGSVPRRTTTARCRARDGATRASSPRFNGGCFLTDHFPDAYKAIWDFHGRDATSRHIPGVRDAGITQGDGEITFCGAIEMGGFIAFGVDLIKGGMATSGITTNPVFIPGRLEPRYDEFISFVGVSVEDGTNYYNGATVAFRRACLNAIEYLKNFGYSGEQAYLLLGSAPVEGRVSGVVDILNACCSLYVPTAIFDFDVRPSKTGPTVGDRGSAASNSSERRGPHAGVCLHLRELPPVRRAPADGRGVGPRAMPVLRSRARRLYTPPELRRTPAARCPRAGRGRRSCRGGRGTHVDCACDLCGIEAGAEDERVCVWVDGAWKLPVVRAGVEELLVAELLARCDRTDRGHSSRS